MKRLAVIFLLMSIVSACQQATKSVKNDDTVVTNLLNQWHRDVAEFNHNAYFNAMADDAVFIGTDASEVWSKQEFMTFCHPLFERQKTWNFKPIERHIHFDENGSLAWFDETLDTWMGICRGSGVVVKKGNRWLIKQYVLSMTIPNDVSNKVVKIKKTQDSIFVSRFN
ncbi:MAG: hypothetical protein CR968_05375 [Flavobacteriia bacterium]|nr:MAG: hypothetical protein CR968_05375 [Flavobacteriia bacterium]